MGTVSGQPDSSQTGAILGAYAVGALAEMADALRLHRDNTVLKVAIVAKLASFLGTGGHLAALERRLSPRQWQALAQPRLCDGSVPLQSLQVRLGARGATADQVGDELHGLLQLGCLLFVEQPPNKEKLAPTPANLAAGRYSELRVRTFPAIFQVAAERAAGGDLVEWLGPPPAREVAATFLELQRDAYLALRAAAEGRVRITAREVPFKVDVAKLASNSAAPGVSGKGTRKKPAADAPPPARLWFALAALRACGLAETVDGRLAPGASAAGYLKASAAEQAKRLFAGWLDGVFNEFYRVSSLDLAYEVDTTSAWIDPEIESIGGSDIPTWGRLKRARQALLAAIRRGAAGRPGQWLSFSALSTSIRADDPECLVAARPRSYGYSPYASAGDRLRYYEGIRRPGAKYPGSQYQRGVDWDEVEGAYFAQVLREPLSWLGLVDLGEDAAGRLGSFRLTTLGRHVLLGEPLPAPATAPEGPPLVVQPNFDLVVVDATGNLGLLAHLDDFAERLSLDRAATYRLTRASVVRGLDKGLTGDSIASLLEAASATSLPQNVRYSIAEWSRLYERVHLRRAATLLVADSPEQAAGWQRDGQLAGALGRPLSTTTFLVPAAQAGAVAALLAKRHEAPRRVDYSRRPRRLFTVVEPAEVELAGGGEEPYLRYRLGRFAERVEAAGRRPLYRLTPESVRRAVASGLTADGIIGYLSDTATGRVPTDTLLRIHGWAGSYEAVRHQAVIAVEVPGGLSWVDLGVVPAVREAVLARPAPRIALVDPARFEALRAALAERGLRVEPGLTSAAGPPLTVPPPAASSLDGAEPPSAMREGDFVSMMRSLLGGRPPAGALSPVQELRALRQSGRDRPPEGKTVLFALPPDDLRGFLADAIQREVRVAIAVDEVEGGQSVYEVKPKRLWEDRGVGHLDGLCDYCDEIHEFTLDEILGVGEVST